MRTIQEATERIVAQTPFWLEAMDEKLLNLSSLARKIQPEIEIELMKKVNTGAIIIALNRMPTGINSKMKRGIQRFIERLGDLTVKSDICDLTFAHSATLAAKIAGVITNASKEGGFFTVSDGVAEVTIVASQSLKPLILEGMGQEELINEQSNLASITVNLPKQNTEQSGIYYFILRQFAWANINIVEVISTTNEITLVVKSNEINRAFAKLMEMKK
jgi:hypothetical protein